MKNPNGYGRITKLSGNRRNLWRVRFTSNWELVGDKAKRKWLLPDTTRCIIALAEYNRNPYDIDVAYITFSEVYEKWSDVHFEKVSSSNISRYRAAYKLCTSLEKMKIIDIKLVHLQKIVDTSNKNTPTLKKLKTLLGLMWDYCIMNEILTSDKRDIIRYVDIKKASTPDSLNRTPFNKKEIQTLWSWQKSNEYYSIILILIYTGCRIGALLDLKKTNVNIE